MGDDKKQFTKNFLLEMIQVVPKSEKAKYYFIYTLQQSGLITYI